MEKPVLFYSNFKYKFIYLFSVHVDHIAPYKSTEVSPEELQLFLHHFECSLMNSSFVISQRGLSIIQLHGCVPFYI